MVFENQEFSDIEVRLDFNRFVGCRFTNCAMVYGGHGPVEFEGCQLNNVTWVFVEAMENSFKFLNKMYHGMQGGQEFVEQVFTAIRARDFAEIEQP